MGADGIEGDGDDALGVEVAQDVAGSEDAEPATDSGADTVSALDTKLDTAPDTTSDTKPAMDSKPTPDAEPPSCSRDGDCAVGTTCRAVANTATNHIDLLCEPPGDRLPSGSTCSGGDLQCASQICYTAVCRALCASSADCLRPGDACKPVTMVKPGGGTQIVMICQ
jgi:hypothetical protein